MTLREQVLKAAKFNPCSTEGRVYWDKRGKVLGETIYGSEENARLIPLIEALGNLATFALAYRKILHDFTPSAIAIDEAKAKLEALLGEGV
jgi:hypothetical protein